MADRRSLTLNDGKAIPMLAYGTGTAHIHTKRAKYSQGLQPDDLDRDCVDAIKTAIRLGYRHLDNAELYGTEPEVGVAVAESIAEGVIKGREELFISSKVEKDPILAEAAVDRSLERLGAGIGYLDLFLIHTPYFASSEAELQAAWASMEKVKASGKARSIGISNFEASHTKTTLATAKIPPAINQVEYHPYMFYRNGRPLLDDLRADGVAVSVYGALSPMTRNVAGPLDAVLARLAEKHGVSPGMICLRWCIEQGAVVITTSQKEERMREYLGLFDFELPSAEVTEITNAGTQCLEGKGEQKPRIIAHYENLKAK